MTECACVLFFFYIPIGQKSHHNPAIEKALQRALNKQPINFDVPMRTRTYCVYLKIVEMSFSGKAKG